MSLTNAGFVAEELMEARRRTVLHSKVKRSVPKPVLVYDADLVAPEPETAEAEVANDQPSGAVAGVVFLIVALCVAVAGAGAVWYALGQVLAVWVG